MERRQGMRRHALLLTEVKGPGGHSVAGLIYNLSRHGMFVLTTSVLELGQNIYVRVPALAGLSATVWLVGQVVHRNRHGVGVAFEDLTFIARAMTQALR